MFFDGLPYLFFLGHTSLSFIEVRSKYDQVVMPMSIPISIYGYLDLVAA